MSTTRLPELPKLPHTHIMLLSDLQSGTEPGFNRWHMEQYAHAYGLAVWKAAMQQAAEAVPTNWCDELLTGKQGLGQPPYHCPDIERLLSKLRAAILALPLPEQGGPQERRE